MEVEQEEVRQVVVVQVQLTQEVVEAVEHIMEEILEQVDLEDLV